LPEALTSTDWRWAIKRGPTVWWPQLHRPVSFQGNDLKQSKMVTPKPSLTNGDQLGPRQNGGTSLTRDGSVSMRICCRSAERAAKTIAERWKPDAVRQLIHSLQDQLPRPDQP
jgi:hypothetical protein